MAVSSALLARDETGGLRMELRQVRYFVVLEEAGSFVHAAARLRLAQPSLTRQIRNLELEIGTELLERGRRGVRATRAGAAFLAGGSALLARVAEGVRRTRVAHGGVIGTCRIGVGPLAIQSDRVGVALAAVRARFPDLQLQIREMPGELLARALRADEIDVGIGGELPEGEPGIRSEVFYEDPIECAVVAISHPLAQERSVSAAQLRDEPLLLLSPRVIPHVMTRVVDALRRLGLEEFEECETLSSIAALVAAGRGWTVEPISRRHPIEGRVGVPLRGFSVPLSAVLSRRAGATSPIVRNVMGALREVRDAQWVPVPVAPARAETSRAGTARPHKVPALELRHFRAFVVATEERSLSRAAQRIGVTQSALSRQIQDLERELRCSLLERRARGVTPTPAGAVLHAEAAAILGLADDVVAGARRSRRGTSGRCVFGVVATATEELLKPIVAMLAERLPQVEFAVQEMRTPYQPHALVARTIDLGIAHPFPGLLDDLAIERIRLKDDELNCALLSTTHPLASRASVRPEDLADEPFLFVARAFHPGYFDAVMDALARIGLVPRSQGAYDGFRTVWSLAANGAGWGIGLRTQCKSPPIGLVALPIEGLHLPWGFDLLWRRDEDDEMLCSVIELLRSGIL